MLFIEVILFSLAGACLGILTGCTPGIHVNMVSVMIIGIYATSSLDPVLFAALVMSMAVVQTFLDILPAIFLGAPDPDTALSVLPGHRMLLEGKGFEAVKLSTIGSLGSVILATSLALPMIFILPAAYPVISYFLYPLLVVLEVSIVMTEKTAKKMLYALLVLVLSGILGMLVTNSGFMPTDKALFPALSGLFGVSTLLLSSESGAKIPDQVMDVEVTMRKLTMAKSIVVGFLAGMTTGILPAVGSAQATILAQRASGESDHRSFMVAVSGVNTGNMIFGLVALYTIGKARNGAVLAVEEILGGNLDLSLLLMFLGVVLMCGGLGAILTRVVGGLFASRISRAPYIPLTRGIIALITVLVLIISGPKGVLVLITATFVGFLPPILGVKRVHSMGFLMIPTLVYFSGYQSFFLGLL